MQQIIYGEGEKGLVRLFASAGVKAPFLVCDGAFAGLPCAAWEIAKAPRFSGFTANPRLEDVMEGAACFASSRCDAIVAIGGGSSMDTAKCIRAFFRSRGDVLEQPVADTGVPLIAVPTTAGTGSESTHFAVVYREGVKHSVAASFLRPGFVLLEGALLATLPLYQKKCTMLDALCQALESAWSKKATPQSRALSEQAARGIVRDYRAYLAGASEAAQRMLQYANLAGQAIDITTTTAAHAMSYKLTACCHLPHGHAVAVCFPAVWRQLARDAAFAPLLHELSGWLGASDGAKAFEELLAELAVALPVIAPEQLEKLAASVNVQRLENHPQTLSKEDLKRMYAQIGGVSLRQDQTP